MNTSLGIISYSSKSIYVHQLTCRNIDLFSSSFLVNPVDGEPEIFQPEVKLSTSFYILPSLISFIYSSLGFFFMLHTSISPSNWAVNQLERCNKCPIMTSSLNNLLFSAAANFLPLLSLIPNSSISLPTLFSYFQYSSPNTFLRALSFSYRFYQVPNIWGISAYIPNETFYKLLSR